MVWADLISPRLRRPCHWRCVVAWYLDLAGMGGYAFGRWTWRQAARLQVDHYPEALIKERVWPWMLRP